ncbi:MAG: dodecin family protein [Actinobacteria bacterium]|nr:dodecin family protein [Actinomycetota bacterium]
MPDTPGAVVTVIELVGSSPNSFSDAVRNAVKRATKTIRHVRGVDVVSSTADVGEDGELTAYKVTVRIAFVLETSEG